MSTGKGFIHLKLERIAAHNRRMGIVVSLMGIAMAIIGLLIAGEEEQWVRWTIVGIGCFCVLFGTLTIAGSVKRLASLKDFTVVADDYSAKNNQANKLINTLVTAFLCGFVLCGLGLTFVLLPAEYQRDLQATALYFPFLEWIMVVVGIASFIGFFATLLRYMAFKNRRSQVKQEGQLLDKQMIKAQIDRELLKLSIFNQTDSKKLKKIIDEIHYIVTPDWLIIGEDEQMEGSGLIAISASQIKRIEYIGTQRPTVIEAAVNVIIPGNTGQQENKISLFVQSDSTALEAKFETRVQTFNMANDEIVQKHHLICITYGNAQFYAPAEDEETAEWLLERFYHILPHTETKYFKNPLHNILEKAQQRWLNIGAILTEMNVNYIDSLETGEDDDIKQQLSDWWSIENRETAVETLEWLKNRGHRADFNKRMDTQNLGSVMKEMGIIFDLSVLENVSILAWDMGRLVNVARWCYDLKYISEEEAWDYLAFAYKRSHVAYGSWNAFATGYLVGRLNWGSLDTDVVRIVARLLQDEDSPWVIYPWEVE